MSPAPSISEGAALPDLVFDIERERLIRFCGAAEDYGNLHWDDLYMQKQGFGGVIVHGWLTCSVMMRVATDWPPLARARFGDFTVRYLRPNYPGPATYRGQVRDVAHGPAATRITLQLWAEDADRRRLAEATVTADLGAGEAIQAR